MTKSEIADMALFLFGVYNVPYTGISDTDFKQVVLDITYSLDYQHISTIKSNEFKARLLGTKTKEVIEKNIDYWQGRGKTSRNLAYWQAIQKHLIELQKGAVGDDTF